MMALYVALVLALVLVLARGARVRVPHLYLKVPHSLAGNVIP